MRHLATAAFCSFVLCRAGRGLKGGQVSKELAKDSSTARKRRPSALLLHMQKSVGSG